MSPLISWDYFTTIDTRLDFMTWLNSSKPPESICFSYQIRKPDPCFGNKTFCLLIELSRNTWFVIFECRCIVHLATSSCLLSKSLATGTACRPVKATFAAGMERLRLVHRSWEGMDKVTGTLNLWKFPSKWQWQLVIAKQKHMNQHVFCLSPFHLSDMKRCFDIKLSWTTCVSEDILYQE